jgi:molybdate transport system substrate-binding protein
MKGALALLLLLFGAVAVTHAGAARNGQLTVYAASSLSDAFPKIDARAKYQFAGSNMLAAQITQGAPADVFASANTKLPDQLFTTGLCSRPVVFTRNALVVVVPKSNPKKIHSVGDLGMPGVKLVVAEPGVPVGDYTLRALTKLHLSGRVLKNVVSRESDVREVLAKVALGEADAGFVYSTDAQSVASKVKVVGLPPRAQPVVKYGICVVSRSRNKAGARAFVSELLAPAGQARLRAYGFLKR